MNKAFSILEMAVVTVIVGVITAFALRLYAPLADLNTALASERDLKRAQARFLERVRANFMRLPYEYVSKKEGILKHANDTPILDSRKLSYTIYTGLTDADICNNGSSYLYVTECKNLSCSKFSVFKDVAYFIAPKGGGFTVNRIAGGLFREIKVYFPRNFDPRLAMRTLYSQEGSLSLRDEAGCNNAAITPKSLPPVVSNRNATGDGATLDFWTDHLNTSTTVAFEDFMGNEVFTLATTNGKPIYWCVAWDGANSKLMYEGVSAAAPNVTGLIHLPFGKELVTATAYSNPLSVCTRGEEGGSVPSKHVIFSDKINMAINLSGLPWSRGKLQYTHYGFYEGSFKDAEFGITKELKGFRAQGMRMRYRGIYHVYAYISDTPTMRNIIDRAEINIIY